MSLSNFLIINGGTKLTELNVKIPPISGDDSIAMQKKLDNLAKPVKSLGRLEELASKLAGIYHATSFSVRPRTVLVFAADNGVVAEGVSATPKKVTAIQAVNMMNGHTTVAALAKAYDCKVVVTDVGIDTANALPNVINQRIRKGTSDMLNGPAMTHEEAIRCVEIGLETARQEIANGAEVIATGELGMGNTTAASAIIAALLGKDGAEVVGIGSNISQQRLQHKIEVVDASLKRANFLNRSVDDPIHVLEEVGAFELGSMAGAMIGYSLVILFI